MSDGTLQVQDESPLEAASAMLGCEKNGLRNALLTRNLAAGGSKMHTSQGGTRRMRSSGEMLAVPLNASQARTATNALTQEVCCLTTEIAVLLHLYDLFLPGDFLFFRCCRPHLGAVYAHTHTHTHIERVKVREGCLADCSCHPARPLSSYLT